MSMQELDVGGWRFSLVETTQDKRSRRTGTSPQASRELAGFDGRVEGALTPVSGFTQIHTLTQGTVIESGDFFPFTIQRNSDDQISGFIYRFKTGSNYGYAIDYFYNAAWASVVLVSPAAGVGNPAMEVMEFGRFLYLLRKGQEPILIYARADDPLTILFFTDTGPGPQPNLAAPDRTIALGSFTTVNDGQIVLTRHPPSETGLWATPPQEDVDVRKLEAGDYVFAVQWYNSVTGRRSSLSIVAPAQYATFGETVETVVDADGSGPSGSGTLIEVEFFPRYALFEGVADVTKYDQVYLYRSVMVQKAGGTFVAGTLCLDGIYTINDHLTDSQPTIDPANRKRVVIFYRLEDKQLVHTDWYLDRVLFDEDMPFAGAGIIYDGTGVYSNISLPDETPPFNGVGELRWSALLEISPELIPPANRYVPANATDAMIRFIRVGTEVIGFSANRIYFIRKEGGYMKVVETHDGYGLASKEAAEPMGSIAYYLTTGGLYALDSQGQLDAVRAVNDLIINEWGPDGLGSCSMAFDDEAKCLFLLNPLANDSHGTTVCLWMTTAKVSEIHDTTFVTVKRGHVPTSNTGARRALFCDEFGRISVFDAHREKLVQNSLVFADVGLPRISTLDIDGDLVFTIASSNGVQHHTTTGNLDALASLKGAWVYVVGGARHGLSGRVDPATATTSTRFNTVAAFAVQAGDVIVVSPVICRWIGPQIGLVGPDGQPFAGIDHFRSRHISSLNCSFSGVSGTSRALPYATYEGQVFKANDVAPVTTAVPVADAGLASGIRTIKDGPTVSAAFANPSSTTGARTGVTHPSLYPAVRIFAADFNFYLLGVLTKGNITGTEKTSRAT